MGRIVAEFPRGGGHTEGELLGLESKYSIQPAEKGTVLCEDRFDFICTHILMQHHGFSKVFVKNLGEIQAVYSVPMTYPGKITITKA